MTTANAEIAQLFLTTARQELLEIYWPRLRECASSLTAEQLWWRPNDASNSVGNLLMHLNGNVGQWLVGSFEKRDSGRDRPREFSTREGFSAEELLARLGATLEAAGTVLSRLTAEELAATYVIQGKTVSGEEAIFHCVSHFILHYGQIVYAVKALQNRDLGFYKELNATGKFA